MGQALLCCVTHMSVCLSFEVGDEFLVDATLEEESCCSAQLLFSVDPAGRICATMKGKLRGIPRDNLSEGIAVSHRPHDSVTCRTEHDVMLWCSVHSTWHVCHVTSESCDRHVTIM